MVEGSMRILFVHEVNYLSKVVYEMHEFPELLALRGHRVTFFQFPEGGAPVGRSWRATSQPIPGRAYPEAQLTLVTPPTLGGGIVERYVAPVLDVPALRREIRTGGYDAIVLYAVPTTGWQTIRIARSTGIPVLFRALDVSHEIRRSPVTPLIRWAERIVYRGADLLAANTPALADYCVRVSGRSGATTVLLPPVDLSHFARPSDAQLRYRYGIGESEKVVLYMGTFFSFSGLDDVIDSLSHALRAREDLRLVLVGGGEMEDALRRRVASESLGDRVIFTGVVSYADLPAHLAMADVAINPFRHLRATDVALPHKVLQYGAAGIPTVSTRLAGLHGVLGEDCGVAWANDPADAARRALNVLDAPDSARDASAQRLRERIAELFDVDRVTDALELELRRLR